MIDKYKFEQGTVLGASGIDVNGVCLELTRRWVKAQLTGAWRPGDTIYDWMDMTTGELGVVLKSQAERGKLRDMAVEDLAHVSSARRTGGGCFTTFKGLRTRQDVINHVLGTPGVYIYAATAKAGGGHAFSFDTRDVARIAFFDPNQGEFVFTNETTAGMKGWWGRFWDASGADEHDGNRNYKTAFHKGVRELFKYDVPPMLGGL